MSDASGSSTRVPHPLKLKGLRTFAINLERRPDRRRRIELVAQRLELNCKVLTAVDGKELWQRPGSWMEKLGTTSSRAHWCCGDNGDIMESHRVNALSSRPEEERWSILGCMLSHVAALRQLETEDLDHALILEDDCDLALASEAAIHQRFEEGASFIQRVCPEWKIIYLGGVLGFRPKGSGGEAALQIPNSPGLVNAIQTYQAHAYIIRRSAVAEVLQQIEKGFATDAALVSTMRSCDAKYHFRFRPSLLHQDGGKQTNRDSDITIPRSQRVAGRRNYKRKNEHGCDVSNEKDGATLKQLTADEEDSSIELALEEEELLMQQCLLNRWEKEMVDVQSDLSLAQALNEFEVADFTRVNSPCPQADAVEDRFCKRLRKSQDWHELDGDQVFQVQIQQALRESQELAREEACLARGDDHMLAQAIRASLNEV